MSRLRNDNRVLIVLTLAVAALLLSVVGCERKIVGDVQVDETVSDQCFTCHNGRLDAVQGEWINSVHGLGELVDYTNRSSCPACHNQDGFIDQLTTGATNAPYFMAKPIGCFACHNPHENGDLRLREEGPYTLLTGTVFDHGKANLCVNCHHSRGVPSLIAPGDSLRPSSRYGPHHGPQGDLLQGSTGYEGFGGLWSTAHASVVPNGCIGCHMVKGTDTLEFHGGNFIGGHTWRLHDEAGNNLADNCLRPACHGSGAIQFDESADEDEPYDFTLTVGAQDWDQDGVINGYQSEINGMLDSVLELMVAQGVATASGSIVVGTTANPVYYTDEKLLNAYWNWIMLEEDRSHGMHNFGYAQSLLQGAWDYLKTLPAAQSSSIAANAK